MEFTMGWRIKMKWCLGLLLTVSGCAYTHYEDGRTSASRWSFGVDASASKIYVTSTEKTTTIRIGVLESKEAEAVGSAVGAALTVLP